MYGDTPLPHTQSVSVCPQRTVWRGRWTRACAQTLSPCQCSLATRTATGTAPCHSGRRGHRARTGNVPAPPSTTSADVTSGLRVKPVRIIIILLFFLSVFFPSFMFLLLFSFFFSLSFFLFLRFLIISLSYTSNFHFPIFV